MQQDQAQRSVAASGTSSRETVVGVAGGITVNTGARAGMGAAPIASPPRPSSALKNTNLEPSRNSHPDLYPRDAAAAANKNNGDFYAVNKGSTAPEPNRDFYGKAEPRSAGELYKSAGEPMRPPPPRTKSQTEVMRRKPEEEQQIPRSKTEVLRSNPAAAPGTPVTLGAWMQGQGHSAQGQGHSGEYVGKSLLCST